MATENSNSSTAGANEQAGGKGEGKRKAAAPAPRTVFPTAEEANRAKPTTPGVKLFVVTDPDGTAYFTWALGRDRALAHAAVPKGWAVAGAGKPVAKDKVAGLLAQLSPEDRAALLAQYNGTAPAPAEPPAPAPEAKGGGGKGGRGSKGVAPKLFAPEGPYGEGDRA